MTGSLSSSSASFPDSEVAPPAEKQDPARRASKNGSGKNGGSKAASRAERRARREKKKAARPAPPAKARKASPKSAPPAKATPVAKATAAKVTPAAKATAAKVTPAAKPTPAKVTAAKSTPAAKPAPSPAPAAAFTLGQPKAEEIRALVFERPEIVEPELVAWRGDTGDAWHETDVGRIDVLARDSEDAWVVIWVPEPEDVAHAIAGCLARVGWVRRHRASEGEVVRAVVLLAEVPEEIAYSAAAVEETVRFQTYRMELRLEDVRFD